MTTVSGFLEDFLQSLHSFANESCTILEMLLKENKEAIILFHFECVMNSNKMKN